MSWPLVVAGLLGAHLLMTAVQALRLGAAARGEPGLASVLASGLAPSPVLHGVSVIIPAWNDAALLPATLHACQKELAGWPAPTELIVVAGGPDGTHAAALVQAGLAQAGPRLRVLRQAPHGKNAALNQGLQVAAQPLLVLLDADTVVQPGWLAALTRPLLDGQADATTGCFTPSRQGAVSRIFEVQQRRNQQLRGAVTLFGGGSLALTRAALNSGGGRLPNEVLVGVDYDLTRRLRAAGQRLAYCPQARVTTEISSTWPAYWRGEVRWQRAYHAAQLRHLHAGSPGPARLLGLLYVPAVYAVLLLGWLPALLLGGPVVGGLGLWLAFVLWVLGRHVCACLELWSHTREARWLGVIPTYAAGLCVTALACWSALLTPRALSAQFKGQRPTGRAA